jgi:hypothetical protein
VILRNLIEHVKAQNWTAICLDFLIVVAGILIALQISEWNEGRHERTRERDYLERIAAELGNSIKSVENAITAAQRRQEYDLFLIRSVEDSDIVRADPGRFLRSVVMGGWTLTPDIRAHTFEEMKSAGDLAIFRDKALLLDLSEFYTRVQGTTQWNYLRDTLQSEYLKRAAGILTYAELAQVYANYAEVPQNAVPGAAEITVDDAMAARARMLERQAFIEWLTVIADERNYDLDTYNRLLADAGSLRDRILASLGAT